MQKHRAKKRWLSAEVYHQFGAVVMKRWGDFGASQKFGEVAPRASALVGVTWLAHRRLPSATHAPEIWNGPSSPSSMIAWYGHERRKGAGDAAFL
jgi:hypothetical protein